VPDRVLTLRELNRATLARQLLLERESLPATDALKRLAGLQAQSPAPAFIGLWSRLRSFTREDLIGPIERREIVRATMMRATLHLFTAADYRLLRPAIQPALTRDSERVRARVEGLDVEGLLRAARRLLKQEPRSFVEMRRHLTEREPGRDPSALGYMVRMNLPMIQVPSADPWGYSSTAPYAIAESWLGKPLRRSAKPHDLIRRYLAAFGPSTVGDLQAWSGLTGMKLTFEKMRPELRTFRDERGRELFDVQDGPLPDADTPAPPRFVPDYDNLILSHADRTRVIADEHRSSVFLKAARVRATFLLDGFVRGTWKIERAKGGATLVVEPFKRIPKADRAALSAEGEELLRFVEPDAKRQALRFT
jgi:hypothetical protein